MFSSKIFATVQKICSPVRAQGVVRLVSESPLVRGILLGGHTVSPGHRFGTGSDHSDLCGETVRPSRAPGQTAPPHAPTHTPNSWRSPSAPDAPGLPSGFCGCETRDSYDWQTAAQFETATDSVQPPHPHPSTM